MTCPKCNSTHTMTTERIEGVKITWFVAGRDVAREQEKSRTVTGKCLDCGHEWEGE